MDHISSNRLGGGGTNAFICTECGHGFSLYSELLSHLVIHGPLDSFSLDGSSNGFDVAREYVLHENGTFTVVERSDSFPVVDSFPMVERSDSLAVVEQSDSFVKTPCSTLLKPLPSSPVYHPTSMFQSVEPTLKVQAPPPTPVIYVKCETCNKSFNSLRSLQKHQQYRKTEEGHKCTLCCKVFSDKGALKGHLETHAHERFYCCGHCGKRFLRLEALYAHQNERHQSPGKRSVNGQKKSDKAQENSVEKTYPCKKCRLHFFWLSDLQSHSLSHSKGDEATESPASEIIMQHPLSENSHNSYHNRDLSIKAKMERRKASSGRGIQSSFRPYRCGLCGDRFQQLADLKKHHSSHQTETDIDPPLPKLRKPSTTTQTMRGRSSLVKRGGGPRLHPCKYCNRVFNHSSSLSRHMRYHKGTLHTCVICGRYFPQRCDVRRHVAMYHKKELQKNPGLKYKALHTKPEGGPERYSESVTTERRRYKYSSENAEIECEVDQTTGKTKQRVNYKCQECGKRFGLLCVYQRHLRYHKKQGELLNCPHCPSRFGQSSALKRHLNNNHPNQMDGEVDMGGQTSPTGSSQDVDQDKEEDGMGQAVDHQVASGKVLYECTECTENFSCLQKFLQHQTSHGSDNIG